MVAKTTGLTKKWPCKLPVSANLERMSWPKTQNGCPGLAGRHSLQQARMAGLRRAGVRTWGGLEGQEQKQDYKQKIREHKIPSVLAVFSRPGGVGRLVS